MRDLLLLVACASTAVLSCSKSAEDLGRSGTDARRTQGQLTNFVIGQVTSPDGTNAVIRVVRPSSTNRYAMRFVPSNTRIARDSTDQPPVPGDVNSFYDPYFDHVNFVKEIRLPATNRAPTRSSIRP